MDEEMKGDILESTSNSRNGRSLPARTCLKKKWIGLCKEHRSPTLGVGQPVIYQQVSQIVHRKLNLINEINISNKLFIFLGIQ